VPLAIRSAADEIGIREGTHRGIFFYSFFSLSYSYS